MTHLKFWLRKVLDLGKQPKLPLSDDIHGWKIFNLSKATKTTVEKHGTFEILALESTYFGKATKATTFCRHTLFKFQA